MTNSESTPPDDKSAEPREILVPCLRSEDIFQGKREVKIAHEGVIYRLLLTRNGKLILQK